MTIFIGSLLFAFCDAEWYHERYEQAEMATRREYIEHLYENEDGDYVDPLLSGVIFSKERMARYRAVCS